MAWRHPMGHTWRWEFKEIFSGLTEVTETFDYAGSRSPKLLEIFRQPQANAEAVTSTLQKLADRHPA